MTPTKSSARAGVSGAVRSSCPNSRAAPGFVTRLSHSAQLPFHAEGCGSAPALPRIPSSGAKRTGTAPPAPARSAAPAQPLHGHGHGGLLRPRPPPAPHARPQSSRGGSPTGGTRAGPPGGGGGEAPARGGRAPAPQAEPPPGSAPAAAPAPAASPWRRRTTPWTGRERGREPAGLSGARAGPGRRDSAVSLRLSAARAFPPPSAL